jgi:hypothetical protein
MQIIKAIKTTAYPPPAQSVRPDNFFGWGIVDALAAINYLGGGSHPGSPAALSASDTSATGFTANWSTVSGAAGYDLDVSTDAAFSSIVRSYNLNFDVTQYPVTGLQPGTLYYYRLQAVGTGTTSGYSNVEKVSTLPVTAATFTLSQNYPNPFNPGTRIEFRIPEQSNVTLSVFDVLGRHVKTLVNGRLPASGGAAYFALWDGTDEGGVNVASGVYFCRMSATGVSGAAFRQALRMVLLR